MWIGYFFQFSNKTLLYSQVPRLINLLHDYFFSDLASLFTLIRQYMFVCLFVCSEARAIISYSRVHQSLFFPRDHWSSFTQKNKTNLYPLYCLITQFFIKKIFLVIFVFFCATHLGVLRYCNNRSSIRYVRQL